MIKAKQWIIQVAAAACLCMPSAANAQSDSGNADDEIFAAMKALDEVGAILEEENSAVKIDIADLISAAETPNDLRSSKNTNTYAPTKTADPGHGVVSQNAKKSKFDVQTAPAKNKIPDYKVDSPSGSVAQKSKFDVRTAPVKTKTPNYKVDSPSGSTAQKSKFDVRTAPVKTKTPDSQRKAAAQKTKFDVQTAPAKKQASANDVKPKYASDVPTKKANKTTPQAIAKNTHSSDQKSSRSSAGIPTSQALAYVSEVYKLNGVDIAKKIQSKHPTISDVYQYAFKNKNIYQKQRPAIGDLAFFHNTYDRNRDGRWNDWHSLVGIVESIDDNIITVLIYTTKVEKIKLSLKYPELKKRKGKIVNSQLRPDEGAQIGSASKLFAGFANILGDIPSITVVDNWHPGMKLE